MKELLSKVLRSGKIILLALLLFAVELSFAQQLRVRGVVRDASGALPGVSVKVAGTTNGTVTDLNGAYRLNVQEEQTLVFSFVGYMSQNISLKDRKPVNGEYVLNVTMQTSESTLNEVVVVGFGTQRKINLTGAVGTVSSKELESRPTQNAVQALQGLVPGLNISTQGIGGTLNAGRSVNVRGTGTISSSSSGSPLVLVDGMEGSLDAINPQDIENISVLKDAASAAVYGSRAPFGVILVTTKKGKSGVPQISYNNSFRKSAPVLLPHMMSSYEFVNYFNDADYNGGGSGQKFPANFVQRVKDYMDGKLDPSDVVLKRADGKWDYDYTNGNVNWMEQYYKDWAPTQEHNVSIGGGSDKWTYYLSGNYLNQEGLMRYNTDTYDRYTATAKISGALSKYVQVDYLNRFVRTNYERPTYMTDDFYDHIMRRARPIRPVNDPNGHYMADINYIDALQNGGRRNDELDFNTQQLRLTVSPTKNWNVIGELNYRTETQFLHEEAFKSYAYMADGVTRYTALTSVANDYVYEYGKKLYFYNPNIYTNYSQSIGNHNFKALLGFQSEWNRYRDLSASRKDIITTSLPVLNLTANATPEVSGQVQEWSTAGFFGRINYDYKGKYLLEGNLRYDGTSRFRSEDRWSWSPSFSAGWNIASEDFWKSLAKTVSVLKLRASYGKLGNQNTNTWYPTYATIGTGTANGSWLVDGAKPNTANAPGLISTSLTWEKIRSWNFGADWEMFRSRLTGSFDYFLRYTDNGVGVGETLPATLGTGVPDVNNIDILTKGFEISVGWNDRIGTVAYGVRVNLSDARTKVLSYPNPTQELAKYIAGRYNNEIWGYHTVGIAKTKEEMDAHLAGLPNGGQSALGNNWGAGDIMYFDTNGDGKISNGGQRLNDRGDLEVIGNSTPRYALGVDLNARWKGFDFRMFWQGILKRDWAPAGMMFWGTTSAGEFWSTALKDHLDYFRPDADDPLGQNLDSYYPRPIFGGKNQNAQTRYLLDASYMRLKNAQIGYTIPADVLKKVKISNLRLFFSGENLLTITDLNNTLDPESIGIGRQGGTVYPLQKVYSFGLSANF
ncbi:SusC/RagA family TonB-linked outer membrane protein [Arcticibacter sp. MXS-1]|uniref:SusC/RagA family TonB-linked outer membrane protein n=1 Tax=Arcticibacter sp. MXS-1 TaxID=3341726 RepID=UPI0035A879AC